MADRLEQVGLAQADAAVDEQRVVGFGRGLGHRERGGMRETVAAPDDERVKRVFVVADKRFRGDRPHRGEFCGWCRRARGRDLRGLDDKLYVYPVHEDLLEGFRDQPAIPALHPLFRK
jgi:hypothetical protein